LQPDRDTFAVVARRLGLDDVVFGVETASAAGSRCRDLTTTLMSDQLKSAGADWTAEDLADAPAEVLMW
jgi:hypothetical protein